MKSQLKNERGILFLPHQDLSQLEPKASVQPNSFFFFGICLPQGLLPVLGPCERYLTPTLDVALLINYVDLLNLVHILIKNINMARLNQLQGTRYQTG